MKNIGKKTTNGFWAPACSNHVYSTGGAYASASFKVPANSEYELYVCVNDWISEKAVNHNHIDNGNWPINKPCSGLASLESEWFINIFESLIYTAIDDSQ